MIEIIYQINNFIEITLEKNQEYLRYRLEIKEFLLFFLTTNGFNKSKFFFSNNSFSYIYKIIFYWRCFHLILQNLFQFKI